MSIYYFFLHGPVVVFGLIGLGIIPLRIIFRLFLGTLEDFET